MAATWTMVASVAEGAWTLPHARLSLSLLEPIVDFVSVSAILNVKNRPVVKPNLAP